SAASTWPRSRRTASRHARRPRRDPDVSGAVSLLLALVLAPLLQGLIKTTKARMQMRLGPPLFQPYADLWKLARKGTVVPETTTWVFRAAPYVVLGATLAAAALVPTLGRGASFGDAVMLGGLLALGRFALALAALDTASNFA